MRHGRPMSALPLVTAYYNRRSVAQGKLTMTMKKLDKKQLPQFAALCVLTAGVFGYFVLRLITPSPAAASTRPHSPAVTQTAPAVQADPKPASVSGAVTPVTDSTPAAADSATADSAAPAPTQGMRDPFVVGYVGPKTPPPSAPAASPAPVLPAPSKLSLPKIGPRMTSLPATFLLTTD